MNGIGLMFYFYGAVLSALLGLVPMYFIFFECPKLEIEKIKKDIILQYKDNLKKSHAFRNCLVFCEYS